MRVRKCEEIRVSFLGELVHARTARVWKGQNTRCLVKGFPRGIVHRLADQMIFPVVRHLHKMAVSAGNHQTKERRFQVRV